MDYILYISTPANTTEADPLTTSIRLSLGRLSGGFLFFPRGPSGYLHFQAFIGGHQIIPYNKDQSYRLNGCVVPFNLDIDFFEPPYIIDCVTSNTSTSYDHALTVGFFLDPLQKRRSPKGIVNTIVNAVTGYKTGGDRKV